MWIAIATAANVISWHAAAVMLAAMVISGVLGLLAEWQRRLTIKATALKFSEL